MSPFGAVLAGPANVVMQLGWPAVGHGVVDGGIESGSVMKHPLKRARTTFSYLAVAMLGDERDGDAFRRAVDVQHAQVRSGPSSPVRFNAMDPRLQLWVAACLYRGLVDVVEGMHGPLDDVTADRIYAEAARLGTTLQVRPGMWPPDRAAFDRYWDQGLAEVRVDDATRRYLLSLIRLENLPRIFGVAFGHSNLFWTRGFLPPVFREQMGFSWSETEERGFRWCLRCLGRIEDLVPPAVRALPFTLLLADVRRRVRAGRPLV